MDLEQARRLWNPTPGWLNTASYGLPPRTTLEELSRVLTEWHHGSTDWHTWDTSTHRARAAFAALTGAPAADIALGATTSQMLSTVATALPAGATVLAPQEEFTSNLFPWAVAAHLRTVPLDRVADSIDAGTTLVAFSLVQSATGQIAPVQDILTAARDHDALVVTDATQAVGWLPVDATRFDALVCSAYKWLMAPRGAAYAYLAPRLRERLRPIAANWYAGADPGGSYYGPPLRLRDDAAGFDLSPAWFSQVGAAVTLELLGRIGVEHVHAHNTALAARFRHELGLPPTDSATDSATGSATGSAIVTADIPDAEERLRNAGVRAAVRAGRLRASFHLYSTQADVDLALNALT
ncbi:aminotransferase class V [Microtetraspora sp. NBRC 13810]|uniref:aminotransferase class V-fold PLP-dependent enzyme n=1 Tax=Microtetraspora sp. NBRC 13810 TaxID=3030990 RepID=UPI0024A2AF93|nr:aminotransferase class V-fold PLP-dependent enzyme [Microtetraspora sp. NBRC 13810]GLW06890.1 aminotransferase class V [Microtetraspora sp. NBRC 13810]